MGTLKSPRTKVEDRFGRLLVLTIRPASWEDQRATVDCLCDCGNTHTTRLDHIRAGVVTSCGCALGTRMIEIDGVSRPFNEVAEEHGIEVKTAQRRVLLGWEPIRAATTPTRPKRA